MALARFEARTILEEIQWCNHILDHCNDIDADDVNVLVKAAWDYLTLCLVDQHCVRTSLAVLKAFVSHSDQGIVLLLAQQEEAMELICKLSSYAKVLRYRVPA